METRVSVAELETDLADALERVRGGERVVVERDGQAIAMIVPPEPKPGITWGEFVALIHRLEWPDEDFAADLEAIHAAQPPATAPEWPD